MTIYVEAAARLHFGVLDLRGSSGRWFGGVGAAAPGPTLLVSAAPASTLHVEGEDASRAAGFARCFLSHYKIQGGAHVRVHRALPSHAGLGSGTQLALAVARALAELHGVDAPAESLARATGRADRSAIGTWTFADGGLVVEGGRVRDSRTPQVAPLIARVPFPPAWRCVVAVPHADPAISGAAEDVVIDALPPPPQHEVERQSHVVLMSLLPALREGDLAGFGAALNEMQETTGRWFAPVQGGTFAPGASAQLVARMVEWGASGGGQSSWGPTVYGIVEGDERAGRLADQVHEFLGTGGDVYAGPFRRDGARVWKEPSA